MKTGPSPKLSIDSSSRPNAASLNRMQYSQTVQSVNLKKAMSPIQTELKHGPRPQIPIDKFAVQAEGTTISARTGDAGAQIDPSHYNQYSLASFRQNDLEQQNSKS